MALAVNRLGEIEGGFVVARRRSAISLSSISHPPGALKLARYRNGCMCCGKNIFPGRYFFLDIGKFSH